MKLTFYVEEHHDLGGNITIRLDNGDFAGLIYSLLVFSLFHVDIVPLVTTYILPKNVRFWGNLGLIMLQTSLQRIAGATPYQGKYYIKI